MDLVTEKTIHCPKCSSIFVEDDYCEACGYRFNVDQLGQPFGQLSFYEFSKEWESWLAKWWAYSSLEKRERGAPDSPTFYHESKGLTFY